MRYFVAGSRIFLQIKGIPIGGPLSGAVLDAILQHCEAKRDESLKARTDHYCCGRYVDDTICISYTCCRRCVKRCLFSTYADVVSFDAADDIQYHNNSVHGQYLDAHVHLTFENGMTVTPACKNHKYIFTGDPNTRKKRSIEPVVGNLSQRNLRQHISELKGRVARWTTISNAYEHLALMFTT